MSPALTLAVWFWSFLASAVMPWISAELVMLALLPTAVAHDQVVALAAMAVTGQMAGKTLLYWIARGGTTAFANDRFVAQTERWRPLVTSPGRAMPLLLASSVIGFPPLFALTILAGSLRLRFRLFFLASTIGRIIHFGAIALLPAMLG
jgi:membrane protein YqaA with SNARE-associated domain